MKSAIPVLGLIVIVLMTGLASVAAGAEPGAKRKVVLVVHGGVGVRAVATMTPDLRKEFETALRQALQKGFDALKKEGGTSLDGVEAAIKVLEDCPLFNAGKGAVFTHEGRIELDASIMEGKEKRAGAVAGVSRLKNPISAARAVMEKSPHVMMVGKKKEGHAMQSPPIRKACRWAGYSWRQKKERTCNPISLMETLNSIRQQHRKHAV
jgi:beta-aspartyl-peptidase (threonine type)